MPIIAINQHGSAFSSRGVPDILMCIAGKFVAVELKVGNNKPTDLQSHYLDQIYRAAGYACVIYDLPAFKTMILDIFESDNKEIKHALYKVGEWNKKTD